MYHNMNEIVLVISIVLFLLIILSLLLYFVVKRTNRIAKNKFMDNMIELNVLVEDKEKTLDDLNNEIESKKKQIKELNDELSLGNVSKSKEGKKDVVLPKYTDFEDGNILENYKYIKKHFNIDMVSVVKEFLNNQLTDSNDYREYMEIKNIMTYDVVYKLYGYSSDEQLLILDELLNDKQKDLFKKELSDNPFSLKKFLERLDKLIEQTNPEIKILVGDNNVNFDYLDSNIKTLYDESISEGLKIIYKGIIYDYSI